MARRYKYSVKERTAILIAAGAVNREHSASCAWVTEHGTCTCGFNAALLTAKREASALAEPKSKPATQRKVHA